MTTTKQTQLTPQEEQDARILDLYQRGIGSLQDIARIERVSVEHVLNLTGNSSLSTVEATGDLIDEKEAGPGATINYGRTFTVPFSTD